MYAYFDVQSIMGHAAHSDIGMPLYQQRIGIQDLPLGSHKLTVQVPEHNNGAYVIIDAFEILNNTVSPAVEADLIINQAWNYEGLRKPILIVQLDQSRSSRLERNAASPL